MLAGIYLLLTWLLASFPTGVVAGTLLADVDVRTLGSGNIGATNVHRVLGRGLGALTLVGDMLKGLLPVLVAPLVVEARWYAGLVGLVAFAGHCWSGFLDFRGGKGVATGSGAMLALAPLPTLLAASVWGLVLAIKRRSSLAGLAAAVCLVPLTAWLQPDAAWVAFLLSAGILLRHSDNIRRLREGTEGP